MQFLKNAHVLLFFILADLLFVLLHLTFGQFYNFFNLDIEHNLPTIYQGIKLLLTTYILIEIWKVVSKNKIFSKIKRIIILLITFVFGFLAIDELAQIHENFPLFLAEMNYGLVNNYEGFFDQMFNFHSAEWVLFYIPIFLIFFAIMMIFIKNFSAILGKRIVYIALGILFMFIVPVIEILNTSGNYPAFVIDNLVILEEFLEMVGISLILYSFYSLYRKIDLAKATLNQKWSNA